ncbi:MAG: hypothetical protein ACP5TL_03435 [Candidatus Micrarchaeia archaeon]
MEVNKVKSNFSLSELHYAYSKLEEVFGKGNIMFIGGRATNLICEKNQRPTHDIDIVINGLNEEQIESVRRKAIDAGFIIPKGQKGGLERLELVVGNTLMAIDLYYDRPISGIPIDYLFEKSINLTKTKGSKNYEFRVAHPATLVVLKMFAYLETHGEIREKHETDIKSILDLYHGPNNFFKKESAILEELFPDQKNRELLEENILQIYNASSNTSGIMLRH